MSLDRRRLISPSSLAPAEFSALRLDGVLQDFGNVEGTVGPSPTMRDRAEYLAGELAPGMIAECESVLWVHGALYRLPRPVPVCVDIRHRYVEERAREFLLRQVVIDPDQWQVVHGVPVTVPARTVLDLVRRPPEPDWLALRAFVTSTGVSRGQIIGQMERRVNLPHKRRALARVERLWADQPAVTR